ncbi:hypothetical protein LWM68_38750 [Niabella sp. W65]|nr:hypothetical protein [Niabella sp. W65]MCH7368154.1 hypothetical protein [Niabella sp. W65]
MEQRKVGLWWALSGLLMFFVIRAASFYNAGKQQKLIVYNANRYAAMDIIKGRNYAYYGDAEVLGNASVMNYVLHPSRILHRVTAEQKPKFEQQLNNALVFHNKKCFASASLFKNQSQQCHYRQTWSFYRVTPGCTFLIS